jgi:asparagine synthetase B (glutamine-hydrolysing)
LLVQEDKIAMMSSVESRVPFVDDHKIVELAYSSPSRLKTFDGREKYIVREYSKGKINESIINRNKYPFPEPPQLYNDTITKLCKDNWHEITNCKIIKLLIKSNLLDNIENFSEVEQWWLLCYWRFEVIFNMEV